MSETEKRLHRCCFSGHRPEKIAGDEYAIVHWLYSAIQRAIDEGYQTFITGMARGVDIWAAEQVIRAKLSYPNVRLICAIPHPDFEISWGHEWQRRYHNVLDQSDLVKTISTRRSLNRKNDSYQIRNEWMVDHSSKLICVYNGQPSGTRNTIEYAQSHGLNIDCMRIPAN